MATPYGMLAVGILITIGSCFQVGYHFGICNSASGSFRQLLNTSRNGKLTDTEFSLIFSTIQTAGFLASILTLFLTPIIAELFGRKWAFLVSEIFSIIGTAITCTFNSHSHPEASIIVGTFIIGIHASLNAAFQPLYFTEISPTEWRGVFGAAQELAFAFSACIGTILGMPAVLGDHLVLLFALGAIPPATGALLILAWPDSPKHLLLTRGDEDGTRKSIVFFRGRNTDADALVNDWRAEQQSEPITWKNFEFRYAIVVGVLAVLAQSLCGYFGVVGCSTMLVQVLRLPSNIGHYLSIALVIVLLIANIVSMFIISRFPRRCLFFLSLAIVIVCGFWYIAAGGELFAHRTADLRYSAIGAFFIIVAFAAIGVGPIPRFLTSEMVVAQAQRSTAQSIVITVSQLVTFASVFSFYQLVHAIGTFGFLIVYSVPSIVLLALLALYMPETQGWEIVDIVREIRERRSRRFWLAPKNDDDETPLEDEMLLSQSNTSDFGAGYGAAS